MDEQFSYEGLYRLLEERRAKRPEGSYTTYLLSLIHISEPTRP